MQLICYFGLLIFLAVMRLWFDFLVRPLHVVSLRLITSN
jgi:hypothetical protein